MAESQSHFQVSSASKRSNHKPFPMKIFASWEIDNSSPHCVPRLCMLTATSLQILDISEIDDCKDVVLSVQMQRGRNRRVLRSGSIELNTQCTETELEITFSLQYPHFLKRDDNCLRISLQRRNRSNYKKFLGFKIIAMGIIDLSQVLQKPLDLKLDMYSTDSKQRNKVIATVTLQHITSKPLSNLSNGKHNSTSGSGVDRSENSDSDDDYENSYSEDDNQQGFRSENQVNEQRNIKQRFAKLLRRFKSSDDAEKQILNALERKSSRMRRSGQHEIRDEEISGGSEVNLDDLFDELENLSDSDNNEQDNISILSTPKPTLPIYFTECGSSETLVRNSLERDATLTHDASSTANNGQDLTAKFTQKSLDSPTDQPSLFPNKFDILLYERIFTDSDLSLPECVYLVDERPSHNLPALAHSLYQSISKLYPCNSVKITNKDETTQLILRLSKAIEKFCNSNSVSPTPVKLVLIGADGFFSMVLDTYVKVFSNKPPDWLNYVRTVVVPLGRSALYSRLCQFYPSLNNTFGNDSNWNNLVDKASSSTLAGDCTLMVDTLRQTVNKCIGMIQTPICEAMITYKPIQCDQNQVQQFIPFITDVLIGNLTVVSEPNTEEVTPDKKLMMSTSPPSYNSPQQNALSPITTSPAGLTSSAPEIVLDFWSSREKSSKTPNKETLKGLFKYIIVYRERNYFTLECQLKDKKQKNPVMRIGKRPKDKTKDSDKKSPDQKSGKIIKENITRIVCSTKDDSNRLSVLIDQVEYTGVHFFQLSTQWQSHVKHLPIAVKQAIAE